MSYPSTLPFKQPQSPKSPTFAALKDAGSAGLDICYTPAMSPKTKKSRSKAKRSTGEEVISIRGARVNNLKNVSVDIPKEQLVVVCGVSGSGKSSLTMDTLYAEGQRRYVESLSSYARQFLMRMKKPEVDYIHGICPAIAIEQKTASRNARSTVGTMTEIYDYFRLLFARAGKTISPISGKEVRRFQVSDVSDFIHHLPSQEGGRPSQEGGRPNGAKVQLLAPLPHKYADRKLCRELEILLQKGYSRVFFGNATFFIEDLLENPPKGIKLDQTLSEYLAGKGKKKALYILIDRFVVKPEDEENRKRISDSIGTAFAEGEGHCVVLTEDGKLHEFNNRFSLDGMEFPDPTPQLFNFNNSYGACPVCEGYGRIMGIDEDRVVPDKTLSVYEGAVVCWRGEKYSKWLDYFVQSVSEKEFPIHRPYKDLTARQKKLLWQGKGGKDFFPSINAFFEELEAKLYKIQNRVMLARYRGKTTCPTCEGSRLRKEALYVQVGGKTIHELVQMPVKRLLEFFGSIKLDAFRQKVAGRLLLEIQNRLRFMQEVGLDYLHLDRLSATLSGGETQRINLTRILGSNLTSSLYLLDEPSIGLHPRDTRLLVQALKRLRDLGNTVVVVEHEEEILRNADYLIDVGPLAGRYGGKIVFAGPYAHLKKAKGSLTADYLQGKKQIPLPKRRALGSRQITLRGAAQHNLKDIDVTIPLGALSVVCGVSGSGKSTLINDLLYQAVLQARGQASGKYTGIYKELTGDVKFITDVQLISQKAIGRSSRSNPVTYVKAYEAIRQLMANQPMAHLYGFSAGHFSFNIPGGRCEACKGEGVQTVEMQFLADITLTCETCRGKRFREDLLEVSYRGKNIHDILCLTVDEALEFFADIPSILNRLRPLEQVGLGYLQLGQASGTLSGGEAQRLKLASFLLPQPATGRYGIRNSTLFLFDEPTVGLHFHDILKLLDAFQALVNKGHTVVVIEHNLEILKSADYLIELGPEGGEEGGYLLYQGPPEGLLKIKTSPTAKFLKDKL